MRTLDLQTLGRLFEVDESVLLAWITEYGEHLSRSANASDNQRRRFTERDLRVLLYVNDRIEGEDSSDEIHCGLNSGQYETDNILEQARLNTPIFQDVPEEIDDTWRHGVLIGGMAERNWHQVAQSYKRAADSLVAEALKSDEPEGFDYPIFYLFRHCLELYLKTMLGGVRGHDFARLIKDLEMKYAKTLGGWIRDRLWDFHEIDEKSDMFRYPEDVSDGELWIDFYQLKYVMNRMTEAFDTFIQTEQSAKKT
jgi:hypothetical protein